MDFSLLPALHLERGRVREALGEPAVPFLQAVARKHGEIVLVDADGLAKNQPALETIQAVTRNRIAWVDAGSRSVADVSDLFIAGAARVTTRWNTLVDVEELEEAADVAEALYLGVEIANVFVENKRARLPLAKLAELATTLALPVVVIDLTARAAPTPAALSAADAFAGVPERWYMGQVDAKAASPLAERGFTGALLPWEHVRDLPDAKTEESP